MTNPDGWCLLWPWKELRRGLLQRTLSADGNVRAAVGELLHLEAVSKLEAEIAVAPWLDGIEIRGRIDAIVTLLCGVTLEPIEQSIEQPFCVRIVPPESPNGWAWPGGDEVQIDLEADDPPDVLAGSTVDIGALIVEHLALAIPPFPKKPGAVFVSDTNGDTPSPFSALAALVARSPGE